MDLLIVLYTPVFLVAAFIIVIWLYALIRFFLWKTREPPSLAAPQNDLEAGYHQHDWINPDQLADDLVASPTVSSPQAPMQAVADAVAYDDSGKTDLINHECVICLVGFEDGEVCRVLVNCKHVYHKECIDEWMSRSLCCPICRESGTVNRKSHG